jgi:hypothetical protein
VSLTPRCVAGKGALEGEGVDAGPTVLLRAPRNSFILAYTTACARDRTSNTCSSASVGLEKTCTRPSSVPHSRVAPSGENARQLTGDADCRTAVRTMTRYAPWGGRSMMVRTGSTRATTEMLATSIKRTTPSLHCAEL